MILSIWIGAVLLHTGMIVFLSCQFLKYREGQNKTPASVSIIVAAHNESGNLKSNIPFLLNQDYTEFEVIVSLDRSTDESLEILRSFKDNRLRIVEIDETPAGYDHKKYALIKAVESSRMDWLVFTDADCFPTSTNWLKEVNSKMDPSIQVILGISPYSRKKSFLNHFIQYETFVTAFNYLSNALSGHPYMGIGRNMAIKKSFFLEKGGYEGFQSHRGGDDDLFIQKNANKKNTAVILSKDSHVSTTPESSWRDYMQQKTRHLSAGTKYSILDQFLLSILHLSQLLFWLLIPFISVRIILPVIAFYLLTKMIGYRFAQGKIGIGFNNMLFPLVDLSYAIFIPIVSLRSKLLKDIRWKK